MAVDQDFVFDIAPELKSEPGTRVDRFIELATLNVNATVWGEKTDFAIALLTAHYLTRFNDKGRGPVTSEKVGDLARSYGNLAQGSEDELLTTAYGEQFVEMRRSLVITPRVLGC